MRKTWKKFPVGSATWKVVILPREKVKEKADGHDVDGLTVYAESTIYICADVAPERFAGVVLHELYHVFLEDSGADKKLQHIGGKRWTSQSEEELVRCLEAVSIPALTAFGLKIRKPKL